MGNKTRDLIKAHQECQFLSSCSFSGYDDVEVYVQGMNDTEHEDDTMAML